MTSLALAACTLGGAKLLGSLGALYAPDTARRAMLSFPRHDVSGWLLTAINLFWSGWLLLSTPPFSEFAYIEPIVYVGMPVIFFALVLFLDEMLAARALGGFILLLACPILNAARWHESRLSLLMSLLAYVWIVYGTVLVVSPFRLRTLIHAWTSHPTRFRVGSLLGCALGALLLILGIGVY